MQVDSRVVVRFPPDRLIPTHFAAYHQRPGVLVRKEGQHLWVVAFPGTGLANEVFHEDLLAPVVDQPRVTRKVASGPPLAVIAYTFLQPLRKVVGRVRNPGGQHYYDETLECGHRLEKQRNHKRKGQPHYLPDHRRCPQCPPDPPPLKGVEVIIDEAVPFVPGDGRRIGFQYINDAARVSLKPTKRIRMNPAYHATLPKGIRNRKRLVRPVVLQPWICELCGKTGDNPGGRATHYRVKHKKEG
jgi:hypothetical protein